MRELVSRISSDPNCVVFPPSGNPQTTGPLEVLPDDVNEFYNLCGGIKLFVGKDYTYNILPPSDFVAADSNKIGECECDGYIISKHWYFIANDDNGSYIAIDTHPDRNGQCYDCMIGEPYPGISHSFTEFLERLYQNAGEYPYWLQDESLKFDPCW